MAVLRQRSAGPMQSCRQARHLRTPGSRPQPAALHSPLLVAPLQNQSHGAGKRFPFGLFQRELFSPRRRQPVESGPLAFVRHIPCGRDPALRFQSVQRGVQRSGFNLKYLFRGLLDVLRQGVTMRRSALQRPQNENVECALEKFDAFSLVRHWVDSLRFIV